MTDHIIDSDYDVVVDGIFGVGLKRDVAGIWRETIETMNGLGGFKVAIDTPSGVDASTGQIMGCAFKAGMTVTFGLNKRGLIFYPGCEISGEVVVRDIGFAQAEVDRVHPVAYSYNRDDLCMLPGQVIHQIRNIWKACGDSWKQRHVRCHGICGGGCIQDGNRACEDIHTYRQQGDSRSKNS